MTFPETQNANFRKTRLNHRLDQRLLAYVAAASAAGIGALGAPSSAQAKVVFTPANINLGASLVLDVNHDGIGDFKFVVMHSSVCIGCTSRNGMHHDSVITEQFGKLNIYAGRGNQVAGQGTYASAIPLGAAVGPNGNFPGGIRMVRASDVNSYTSFVEAFGPWKGTSFGPSTIKGHSVGFKFLINGETHYGWARLNVSITKGAFIQATLTGYAYETTADTPLTAGIPGSASQAANPPDPADKGVDVQTATEKPSLPPSLGLLAQGAIGIGNWRAGQH